MALIVHVEPAASVPPQLSVSANVGLGAMPSAKGMMALFLTVNVCGALVEPIATEPKKRVTGVTVMGRTPVPARLIFRGLPAPASVMLSVPLKGAALEGVMVTSIVQNEAGGKELPQLLVWLYSGKLVTMLLIARAVFWLLVKTTDFTALAMAMA